MPREERDVDVDINVCEGVKVFTTFRANRVGKSLRKRLMLVALWAFSQLKLIIFKNSG